MKALDTYTKFMIHVSKKPPATLLFTDELLIEKEWDAIKPVLDHISGSYEQYVTFFINFAYNLLQTVQKSKNLQIGPIEWKDVKILCTDIRVRCVRVKSFLVRLYHEMSQCCEFRCNLNDLFDVLLNKEYTLFKLNGENASFCVLSTTTDIKTILGALR